MPRFTGAIYELLSAPVGVLETLVGFVGAAVMKSLIISAIIMATALLFVDYSIAHPLYAFGYIVLVAAAFSLFGFILGLWADGFEKLQIVPLMVVTPLTFLGGSFYSISMLPGVWAKIALFNPVVYLVSGFRWAFYGVSDVGVGASLTMTLVFMLACLGAITAIFRTGWRLKA